MFVRFYFIRPILANSTQKKKKKDRRDNMGATTPTTVSRVADHDRFRCTTHGDDVVLTRVVLSSRGYLTRDRSVPPQIIATPIDLAMVGEALGRARSRTTNQQQHQPATDTTTPLLLYHDAVLLSGDSGDNEAVASCLWLGFAVFGPEPGRETEVWWFAVEPAMRLRQRLSKRIQSAMLWVHDAREIDWPTRRYTEEADRRVRWGILQRGDVARSAFRTVQEFGLDDDGPSTTWLRLQRWDKHWQPDGLRVDDYLSTCEFAEQWASVAATLTFSQKHPYLAMRVVRCLDATQPVTYAVALGVSSRDERESVASLLYSALNMDPPSHNHAYQHQA